MRIGVVLLLSFFSFWSFAQIGDSTVAHFSYRWNTENVFTIHYADTVQNSTPNYLGEILNVNLDVLKQAQQVVSIHNGDIYRIWIKVENANQINLFFSSIQWNNKDYLHIILPELSIITNIGMDHMALLGKTLSEIASEKAGIIKATTPVVISEVIPETNNIFEQKANSLNAPIYYAEDFIQFKSFQNNWQTSLFEFNQPLIHLLDAPLFPKSFTVECDLPGKYQYKNLKGVLVVIQLLTKMGWKLHANKVLKGLLNVKKNTGLMGRWECIQANPRVILDVAHNEPGIQALLEQLSSLHYNKLHIVTGMVKDKDIHAVLNLLPKY